jgi:hypothetical protein
MTESKNEELYLFQFRTTRENEFYYRFIQFVGDDVFIVRDNETNVFSNTVVESHGNKDIQFDMGKHAETQFKKIYEQQVLSHLGNLHDSIKNYVANAVKPDDHSGDEEYAKIHGLKYIKDDVEQEDNVDQPPDDSDDDQKGRGGTNKIMGGRDWKIKDFPFTVSYGTQLTSKDIRHILTDFGEETTDPVIKGIVNNLAQKNALQKFKRIIQYYSLDKKDIKSYDSEKPLFTFFGKVLKEKSKGVFGFGGNNISSFKIYRLTVPNLETEIDVSKFATKKEIEKLEQQYGQKITLLNIRIQTIIRHFTETSGPLFTFEGLDDEKRGDDKKDDTYKVQDINNEDEIYIIEEDGETKIRVNDRVYATEKDGNKYKIPGLTVSGTNGEPEILDLNDYQKDTHHPTITRYIKKSTEGGKSRRFRRKSVKRRTRRFRKRA